MKCLIFGAKSSPCSAIYVKNENALSFLDQYLDAAKSIMRNNYMDDYLTSQKTEQEASNTIQNVVEINLAANFEMHDWARDIANVLQNNVHKKISMKNREMRLCD